MKKKIALILALCLVFTSFAACTKTSSGKSGGHSGNTHSGSKDNGDDDDDDDDDDDNDRGRETTETTRKHDPTATPSPTPSPAPTEPVVNVKPTDNVNIEWVTYTCPEGYISINAPKGWSVNFGNIDTIGYEIIVTAPESDKCFYFCTSVVGYPSIENFQYWQSVAYYYGMSIGEKGYISPEATAESLFENSGWAFGYDDFSIVSNLGDNGYGGDVLQATCTIGGRDCEGLFTSSLIDCPMYYEAADWDIVSGTAILVTTQENFTDWIGVLVQIYASLYFSDAYYAARNAVWAQVWGTAQALSYNANVMSDMLMDSWEQSNRVYDIENQAYCDAILGRDRVYDTQTGDVYYTDIGWSDSYYGTRYEPVTSGSDYYLQPVAGTIV